MKNYSYTSNFVTIEGISIHYLDEGPMMAPVILFLHGVPTWSFAFRNIFPDVVKAGFRVIVPDLPGFGYSDKPSQREFYSAHNLVNIIERFIGAMRITKVCLFTHDWGAILGMILVAQHPELCRGIIVCNGLLPDRDQKLPVAFSLWKIFTKYSPWLPVGGIVNFASLNRLNRDEREGYNIPFKKHKTKTALRILPQMIPFKGLDINLVEDSWKKLDNCFTPILTVFSDRDPITRDGENIIQGRIPGAKDQHHKKVHGGHFLMEDVPAELAGIAIEFFNELHGNRM
ncbi:MAG: alpha/beta fold hydrolase [Bacteroidales bacterium]|nr:alpha/beta fold hydrolase [Bacteroidales bacterium]